MRTPTPSIKKSDVLSGFLISIRGCVVGDTNKKKRSYLKFVVLFLLFLFVLGCVYKPFDALIGIATLLLLILSPWIIISIKRWAAVPADYKPENKKDNLKSKEKPEIDWADVFNLKKAGPEIITHEVEREPVKMDTWPFDCPVVDYRIIYEAASGELTERNITALNFCRYQAYHNYGNNIYIKAFCHLRNEERTFNVSNIQRAWIGDIPIYDVERYFASIGEGTVAWQGIKAISSCYDEARMLIFFARAVSEILQKKHREMIVQYVLETALDAPFDAVSEELKRITCSMNDFNRLLKNNKIPDERKPKFIDCAKSIFLSRKEPDPIQEAMLKKIEKALNV